MLSASWARSCSLRLLVVGGGAYYVFGPTLPARTDPRGLKVPPGAGWQQTLDSIDASGIVAATGRLNKVGRASGWYRQVKAGYYEITPGSSPYAILQKLRRGEQTAVKVTVPPGVTPERIAAVAGRYLYAGPEAFLRALQSDSLARALGTDRAHLAGEMLPDTYRFFWLSKPEKVVARIHEAYSRLYRRPRHAAAGPLGGRRGDDGLHRRVGIGARRRAAARGRRLPQPPPRRYPAPGRPDRAVCASSNARAPSGGCCSWTTRSSTRTTRTFSGACRRARWPTRRARRRQGRHAARAAQLHLLRRARRWAPHVLADPRRAQPRRRGLLPAHAGAPRRPAAAPSSRARPRAQSSPERPGLPRSSDHEQRTTNKLPALPFGALSPPGPAARRGRPGTPPRRSRRR